MWSSSLCGLSTDTVRARYLISILHGPIWLWTNVCICIDCYCTYPITTTSYSKVSLLSDLTSLNYDCISWTAAYLYTMLSYAHVTGSVSDTESFIHVSCVCQDQVDRLLLPLCIDKLFLKWYTGTYVAFESRCEQLNSAAAWMFLSKPPGCWTARHCDLAVPCHAWCVYVITPLPMLLLACASFVSCTFSVPPSRVCACHLLVSLIVLCCY